MDIALDMAKATTINKHKASIGLSYDTLLQEKVPTDQYDKKVDIIITEEQTLIINEKYNSND